MTVGKGSGWHVHKDHVKYGNNNETRMNLFGRSQSDIQNHVRTWGPMNDQSGYDDCMRYIRKYC
jgi:hypothetical protein